MKRIRQSLLVATVSAVATLVAVVNLVTAGAEESEPPSKGPALADSMGLELITTNRVVGCNYGIEVEGEGAYCLDGHVSSPAEALELGARLRGEEPTDLDRRIFALMQRLGELGDAGGQDALTARRRLTQELEVLKGQKAAANP